MLNLPNVTLIAVATRDVVETVRALQKSMEGITFGSVKLVSNFKPTNLPRSIQYEYVDKMGTIDDWNYYIFYNLYKHIETEFALLIHADGYVIHPENWRDEFLNYDYIGAPWLDKGDLDSNGEPMRVGNSVSIRSRKLLTLPTTLNIPWVSKDGYYNEDTLICIHNRQYFLNEGIKYAPVDVAKYFSHEMYMPDIVGITPFAFHKFATPHMLDVTLETHLDSLINMIPDATLRFNIPGNYQDFKWMIDKAYSVGYRAFSLVEGSWGSKDSIDPVNSGILYIKKHFMTTDKRTFSFEDTYGAYINLDIRPDRREHMEKVLKNNPFSIERLRALLPSDVNEPTHKTAVMQARTPGAIGCHYSQVEVMKRALSVGKHALVMEDDLVICKDFLPRMKKVQEFLNTHDWDVFWLGGTYHIPARWHDTNHTNPDLQNCTCGLGRDVESTDKDYIVRTYGCWSTYAYIVNYNSLPRILDLLDQNVYMSMGIDWLFIKLQPQLKTFAYVPGCIKQYDNKSNIGNGITQFSTFASLGDYWYQDTEEGFDYTKYHKLC